MTGDTPAETGHDGVLRRTRIRRIPRMWSVSAAATSAQGAAALTPIAERVAADTADIVADTRGLGASDGSTVPAGCEWGASTRPKTRLLLSAIPI
jgi:hypothetical protein